MPTKCTYENYICTVNGIYYEITKDNVLVDCGECLEGTTAIEVLHKYILEESC